jgi:cob(I)alamin adenosyltransferase
MEKGKITVFSGEGRGKTAAALGRALDAAADGKTAVIIQFLKGRGLAESIFCKRMEPDIKIFRFEKSEVDYDERPTEQREDDVSSIRNSLGFARKVLATGECDLLILDDFGLKRFDVTMGQDFKEVIEERSRAHRSTGITAQLPVREWPSAFDDLTIADGVMDRIVPNAYRFNLKGPSRRPSLEVEQMSQSEAEPSTEAESE